MGTINGLGGINYALYGLPSKKNITAPTAGQSPVQQTLAGLQAEQRPRGEALAPSSDSGSSGAADEFRKFMAMTPAEKLRYSVLSDMGISEEDLAAMPPEKREQIEKKIEELIKLRMGIPESAKLPDNQQPATPELTLIQQIQANTDRPHKIDIFS